MNKKLEIVGEGANTDHITPTKPITTINQPMDPNTASLLKTALRSGSQKAYKEALLLEKYRDALLDQAYELRTDIQEEIVQKAKKIAPSIFGWNNKSIPGLSKDLSRRPFDINCDYENVWETLVGLESHDYRLEDPKISSEFFSELQSNFLRQDLKNVDPKYLLKYPWLMASKQKSFSDLAVPNQPKKIKRKVSPSSSLFTSKKTTSQKRLEKDLVDKEAELQQTLANKFKANTIPVSSITPKYDFVMKNQGTRSTKIRESVLKIKTVEKLKAEAIEKELIVKRQISKPSSVHTYTPVAVHHKLDPLEKTKAVMKEIMKECTFKPRISKKMPDFGREHQKFKFNLDKSKSQHSTTIPQPFQLSTRPQSRPKKSIHVIANTTPKKGKTSVLHDTIILAKSTKTTELKIKHRQDELEAQKLIDQYQKEMHEVAESKRMAIAERLRIRLENTSKSAKERLIKEKVKNKLKYQQESEKAYLERMEEMEERLDSRKCLFERVEVETARNRSNQQIRDILTAAGLGLKGLMA